METLKLCSKETETPSEGDKTNLIDLRKDIKKCRTIDNYLENEELGIAFQSDFEIISRSKT